MNVSRSRLLTVVAGVPLLVVGGFAMVSPSQVPSTVERPAVTASAGPATRYCPGPLAVAEESLAAGGDAELAVVPPSETIGMQTVGLEPHSSLLFGRVSGSETALDEDGNIQAPTITTSDSAGEPVEVPVGAADVGASVQTISSISGSTSTQIAAAGDASTVIDAVQHTVTDTGDYRSLSVSRCVAAVSDATFLGASTEVGNSAVLRLKNVSQQPATAAVQVWSEDGPAQMQGRSQVVVAPGSEEQILLESVVAGAQSVGARVVTIGAPLVMTMQATERSGLTPEGAEIQTALPAASTSQVIPALHVATSRPTEVILLNTSGTSATASIAVKGPDGEVSAPGLDAIELPAGQVVRVALPTLPLANYSATVTSSQPMVAVARSSVDGQASEGTTTVVPQDFALASSSPALTSGTVLALPSLGPQGRLLMQGTDDSTVTLIPLGSDGAAGTPRQIAVSADSLTTVDGGSFAGTNGPAAAVAIVPSTPGAVHATWIQREGAAQSGAMVSAVTVTPAAAEEQALAVRMG